MSELFEPRAGHEYAIGVDVGLRKGNPTGVAVITLSTPEPELVHYDFYSASTDKADWEQNFLVIGRRLDQLVYTIQRVDNGLRYIAYEYPHLQKNPSVTIKLAHVGGLCRTLAFLYGAKCYQVQPHQAKQALTGHSGAKDLAMQRALLQQYGVRIGGKKMAGHIGHALGCALHHRGTDRINQLINQ